jgi:hypothetical protein
MGYEILLKPTRVTSKGDLSKRVLKVESVDEIPEEIPCGNPDCDGGVIKLREAVQRAMDKPARASRARCHAKEKSGVPCWNMIDVAITRKPGE